MNNISFQIINWARIVKTEHTGETGDSSSKTAAFNALRLSKVKYTPGYLADHWCQKGHIVHCLSCSFKAELQSGDIYTLTEGMSYIVSDNLSSHRSNSENGLNY